MAFLSAYFDDSGSYPEHSITAVAGLAASTKQWQDFTNKWQKILNKNKISVFHMSDFENSKGEFKGWTPDRKDPLIIELIGIIRQYTRLFMGTTLSSRVYNFVKPKFPKIARTPQQICADQCIIGLKEWTSKSEQRKNLAIFFDRGHPLAPEMVNLYCKYSDPPWKCVHADKKVEIPLQAADLIAYELFKHRKNEESGRPRDTRKAVAALIKDNSGFI